MIRAVLLDLAGVVYDADRPLPGAIEAVARLREAGFGLRFLTNTTRTPRRALLQRLGGMGLSLSSEELLTPAQAARDWLAARRLSPHLLVHPALKEDFAGLPEGEGQAVVVGDAAHGFSYDALNTAFRKLLEGAEFVALARNRSFKDEDGKLSIDTGAFVVALEYASLREAVLLGKPAPDFFQAAIASLGCDRREAVMVGDDAEADVAGALAAGLGAALLVRTGKYRPGDEERSQPAPTAIAADLPAATEWILSHRGDGPR
ncbi:MAG TPA: TIGR01458 family HAD-type hydrolase [Methyloceanibacter sp.]|nr:TIGR01458 family HAD-type hydrolase [Methyloceanibacter sp.]